MKRKFILLTLLGLSACATLFAFVDFSGPEISFVRCRDTQYGPVAIFQIINESDSAYCFSGYGSSSPLYHYRVSTPFGWRPKWRGEGSTGLEWQEIAPHGMTEFQVWLPQDTPNAPFAVGLHFTRGTATEIRASRTSSSYVTTFFEWLRQRIHLKDDRPELTWSTVAQADGQ